MKQFKALMALGVATWLMTGIASFAGEKKPSAYLVISIKESRAYIGTADYSLDDKAAIISAIKRAREELRHAPLAIRPSRDTKHTEVVKVMDAIHDCSIHKVKLLDPT